MGLGIDQLQLDHFHTLVFVTSMSKLGALQRHYSNRQDRLISPIPMSRGCNGLGTRPNFMGSTGSRSPGFLGCTLWAELKFPIQVVHTSAWPERLALETRSTGQGIQRRGGLPCRLVTAKRVSATPRASAASEAQSKCLRCGQMYVVKENGPKSCSYHGHMTGEQGMFALAPPHQGIDGDWTDESGVIVYKWKEENERPNTGRDNWKQRWTCCGEYNQDAPPCRKGPHVSYDDGLTMF